MQTNDASRACTWPPRSSTRPAPRSATRREAPLSPDLRLAAGARLGPYTLEREIGRGSTAVVWLGRDGSGEAVAVKVRRVGVQALDRRFVREFESMRALRIPGVVRVHEVGLDGELLWFSMELVHGRPFLDVVLDAPDVATRVRLVVEYGRQLLDILGEVHAAGLVHRDIKPSNVLIGDSSRVKVLDFGVVRFFGEGDTTSEAGVVLGTVPYMAPEQVAGLPFDGRIDLYAAGLMLYEAIDGPRAKPTSNVAWVAKICLERLPPLATRHREVPRGLSYVIEQLLSPIPDARPAAADAARRLRALAAGRDAGEWPAPQWVEAHDWIDELEGVLGRPDRPAAWVLEGPSGAGRGRLTEAIHRQAVLEGVWPIHARCEVAGFGSAVVAWIEQIVRASAEDAWPREVLAADGDVLRRVWPHLPHGEAGAKLPSILETAEASARVLLRAARRRRVVLVVHALERCDELTAQTLELLAPKLGGAVGLLALHDPRWESQRSRRVVATLRRRARAGYRVLSGLSAEDNAKIARTLVPAGVSVGDVPAGPPLRGVEAGLAALARWRGEKFAAPDASLWPLAVEDHLPERVFVKLTGATPTDGWVCRGDDDADVWLADPFARSAAAARLADVRAGARAIEEAWRSMGEVPAEALARLRLRAGDPAGAIPAVVRAASQDEAEGRYTDARRWLLVLDTLGEANDPATAWDLAITRARVALRTEAGRPRIALCDAVDRVAATKDQEQLARLLRAEYELRAGEPRAALVNALRVASPGVAATSEIAVRALLVATHARAVLGQFAESEAQLDRARLALAASPAPTLEVQVVNWASELAYRRQDLERCRSLLQNALRRASETGYVRGAAFAASRLGQVLRLLGRRREAEHQTRAAVEAFQATADLVLDTETTLELAQLRAERGEVARARHLLDQATRRIRLLRLDADVPRAMRVGLVLATMAGDPAEAALWLSGLDASRDDEAPAVLVRWWRTRGDPERALQVPSPPQPESFGAAVWHVERARAALTNDHVLMAGDEAARALDIAERRGYADVALLARLLLGVANPGDDEAWQRLVKQAQANLWVEVCLGALEMDARRRGVIGDAEGARACWRTLRARSEELGYRPGAEEAQGWLATSPPAPSGGAAR